MQSEEQQALCPHNQQKKQSLQVPGLCIWSQYCHLGNLKWTCKLVLQIVPGLKLQYVVQYPSTANFILDNFWENIRGNESNSRNVQTYWSEYSVL